MLVALSAAPLLAQKKMKEAKPGSVELIRLVNRWADAMVTRDRAFFDKYVAPKFVYTENDKLISRADLLRDIVSGTDTVTAARNEDMQVQQFGAVTGVVTGWLIVSGRGAGGPFTRRFRFTDTWVKRDGRWQIVAAQDYLAPK